MKEKTNCRLSVGRSKEEKRAHVKGMNRKTIGI